MVFAQVLKRISPKLKGIAYRLGGKISFLNAEDLFQEAVVYLWQDYQIGGFSGKTDSYLLQGCYFHLKNHLRKVHKRTCLISFETLLENADPCLEEAVSREDTAQHFAYLDSKILIEKMQNNGLTFQEKEVIAWGLKGLTIREIARQMKVSHVRVVKLKASIRKKYAYVASEL